MARYRPDLKDRDVTDEALYLRRREFLALSAGGLATLAWPSAAQAGPSGRALSVAKRSERAGGEKPNTFEEITTYNNFYEFGTDKEDPSKNAGSLRASPWAISFEGELKKPRKIDVEELMKMAPLEERIYRMRCVEAWSMVIPWVGIPLSAILSQLEPTSNAKYVMFETLYDPKQMPLQKTSILAWPYQEGLRMDEAMHPLTMLALGIYGRVLPNQNGAPARLVVPWKYGFKGCKSIVKIRLVERQPSTTWALMGPNEYGFYANVNPDVDHPRWSQAKERRIGEFFKRKTLPFNGYADEVAKLYAGMDPKKLY